MPAGGPFPWTRALVTGASSGIGREMARQLAGAGVEVVLVARDGARLEELAAELGSRGAGVRVDVLVADLGQPAGVAAVAARLGAAEGPVDLLVNNAGAGRTGALVELAPGEAEAMVALNVTALTRLSQAAAAAMATRGGGTILNVSSVAGFAPAARAATYGATKAYVTGFSRALAAELAPRGVVVSCLCPGLTRTEFHQRAGQDPGRHPRWAWQEAAAVAAAGLAGAAAGKVTVVPGRHNQVARYAMALAPAGLLRWVDRRVRPGTRTDATENRS